MMRPPTSAQETTIEPFVPPITPEEQARRNRAAMDLLDAWAEDIEGSEDQRETMEVLREALGFQRSLSDRAAVR